MTILILPILDSELKNWHNLITWETKNECSLFCYPPPNDRCHCQDFSETYLNGIDSYRGMVCHHCSGCTCKADLFSKDPKYQNSCDNENELAKACNTCHNYASTQLKIFDDSIEEARVVLNEMINALDCFSDYGYWCNGDGTTKPATTTTTTPGN